MESMNYRRILDPSPFFGTNDFIISSLERIARFALLFVASNWLLLAPAGIHWHAFIPRLTRLDVRIVLVGKKS